MEERIEACRHLLQDYSSHLDGIECYVDTMNNDGVVDASFEAAYASWPFRFWVLSSTQVLFKAMPKDACYDLRDLEIFLTEYYYNDKKDK